MEVSFIVLIWMVLYVINSMFGGYDAGVTFRGYDPETGRIRYSMVVRWQPLYGEVKLGGITGIGIMFYPLIRLDQKFFHREYDLSKTEDWDAIHQLPVSKIHPKIRPKAQSNAGKSANGAVLIFSPGEKGQTGRAFRGGSLCQSDDGEDSRSLTTLSSTQSSSAGLNGLMR